MRRFAFLIIFVVGTAGLLQWFCRGFSTLWEPRIRSALEESAGQATRTHVTIGAIAPSFFHPIRLLHVQADDPAGGLLFQAGEIELTISLLDLPRALVHRRAYEAVGLVTVKDPRVTLSADAIPRLFSRKNHAPSLPLWFTLAWEGGTLQWADPRAPHGHWTLDQAHGAFRIRGPRMTLAIQGTVDGARSVYLQVSSLSRRWNTQFFVADAGGKKIINLEGSAAYKNGILSSPKLSVACPWFAGTGHLDLDLKNGLENPDVTVNAEFPSGRLGAWPFRDAVLRLRYVNNHWEFLQNSLHWLGGTVALKGYAGPALSDMAVTADNMSLAAMGKGRNVSALQGRWNASCSVKGSPGHWLTSGAWWLAGVQWGSEAVGDARGDFEITSDHFQAQAKSENQRFRIATEGSLSEDSVDVERLEIHLPDGASVTGEGSLVRDTQRISASIDAEDIHFPSDLPFLTSGKTVMESRGDLQGRLSGTPGDLAFKGTLQSAEMRLGTQSLGKTSATFAWTRSRLDVPVFHLGEGMTGRFSLASNATSGWSLELALKTRDAALFWSGKAAQSGDQATTPRHLDLAGRGHLRSVADPADWTVPFDLSGHLDTESAGWSGETRITSDRGTLSGSWTFRKTADNPQGDFSLFLNRGRWKDREFSTSLQGHWSPEGIKPLALKGRLADGGDFQFSGQLGQLVPLMTTDKTRGLSVVINGTRLEGTLKFSGLNLHPLGKNLGFPKPLEGLLAGTLTLNGPLSNLSCSGHLEGGPLSYGNPDDAPFKLEKVSTDLTLAPLENDPSTLHLTLTEGQATTAEELIRIQPGGFVEFSGDKPARLKLGLDIRNLHLGLFTLFGGLDLDGFWRLKPGGFAIQANARTHQLFINDYELEEGLVRVDYDDRLLTFLPPPNSPPLATGSIDFHKTPQLHFSDFFISGRDRQGVRISGDIGPTFWNFQMSGRGLDMGTLSELSGFPYPMSGVADIQVRGAGDPAHPHVEGNIDLSRGAVLGLSFRTGAASFIWQDARISFTKLSLTDPGRYTLEGAGVFPLTTKDKGRSPDHSIDFSIRLLDSNLSLLQSLFPEVKRAKGPVDGLLQIKGTLEDPSLHGSLHVVNGEVLGAHYFRQLREGTLTVDFEGNNVLIRELRGKSGDGEFRGSGSVTLSGFAPSSYDLKLAVVSSKGVAIQVPELAIPDSPLAKRFRFLTTSSRGDVRGHAELTGPAEAPVFSGSAIISNGHFTFPPSRKHPPSPAVLDWFRRLSWDVDLKFQDGAWFDNELVQADVAGALKLKGPGDKLRVDGGLDITEGTISYLGLQFDVRQARYDIRSEAIGDAVVNTPYVRGVAESQIQAVDTVNGTSAGNRMSVNDTITLTIDYAPVDQIKPRLTSASNPTLSQDKILARVTQTDTENLTPQERTALYQKQMVSLIDSSLTTPLAQNVLKKTGIANRVRVQHVFDPNTATAQDLNTATAIQQQQQTAGVNLFANTKYTIEKDLSTRLSLGYGIRFIPSASVDPDVPQQKLDLISDVQLSYRWFRNVYVKGDFDLPNSNPGVVPERKVTIEPRWRFGWWGNTNKDKEKPAHP